MRAGVFQGPGVIEPVDVPDPVCDPGGVILAVEACGVCGTDLTIVERGVMVRPGQVLGHEFAGTVVDVGGEVEHLAVGDRVTALPYVPCGRCRPCRTGRSSMCDVALRRSIANGLPGGFAEYLHLPDAELGRTVFGLPDDLAPGAGALVEPLAVGVKAAASSAATGDDVVIVVGLGTVGLSVVHALIARGVGAVIATDMSPTRLEAGRRAGARVIDAADGVDAVIETARELTGPGAYGAPAAAAALIDCAGVGRVVGELLPALRATGVVVIAALHDHPLGIDAGLVVRRGLSLVGTFGYDHHFAEAVEMVSAGVVGVDDLVSHRFPLDRIAEAFAVQNDASASVKVLVEPGGGR